MAGFNVGRIRKAASGGSGSGISSGTRAIMDAKKLFFRPGKLIKGFDRASQDALIKFGAFTRRDARKALKVARPKKVPKAIKGQRPNELFATGSSSRGELTVKEYIYFQREMAQFERGERPDKPKPPLKTSEPGKPPLLKSRNSPLKRLIYFGYSKSQKSAVVGPVKVSNTYAQETLEKGGTIKVAGSSDAFDWGGRRVRPRPFMKPAYDKNLKVIDTIWKKAVR